MKRIVITGALGHIGSKFIHQIKSGQYGKVVLIDDLSTQRYVSLFNLPKDVNFSFIEGDILEMNLIDYFKEADVVIHLAAITNAAGSFEIQERVEQVNFEGTKKVADACSITGSKLIFLSTTSVYGTQQQIVDENCSDDELKPQSPYAESKLKAEKYIEKLGEENKLNYIIFRFGTIFGISVGMRFHTAINKFVWQACLNKPITVWRTALHQKRPYLDLNDAIRVLNFIIEKNMFNNNIYNILTTNATVNDILEIIKKYIPNLIIEYVDTKIMNQLSYTVSNNKIINLGFEYAGDMHGGIKNTIDLFSSINNIQNKF